MYILTDKNQGIIATIHNINVEEKKCMKGSVIDKIEAKHGRNNMNIE